MNLEGTGNDLAITALLVFLQYSIQFEDIRILGENFHALKFKQLTNFIVDMNNDELAILTAQSCHFL